MARKAEQVHWSAALGSVFWPVLMGAAGTSLFYAAVYQGPLKTPFMYRYFGSHPVLYFETGMFFVGLAAMMLKFGDLLLQSSSFQRIDLGAPSKDGVGDCGRLLKQLDSLPKQLRQSYLGQRLANAFGFVDRKGTAEGLDDELKYLADQDCARQQEGYALVRIVAWATPMLGFLGTVIGITQALGDLDPKLLSTDVTAAMQGLLAGLYVAFDTTALALVLSMILMFLLFFADRIESQLLGGVDSRLLEEIANRFGGDTGKGSPQVKAVEKMSAAVIKTTETLIRQQTEQWRLAMEETNRQLGFVAQSTGEQIRLALGESLDVSLKNHADRLARFEFEADQQMRARWDQWQSALAENVGIVREQQTEVAKQTTLITNVANALGDIATMEVVLNKNLQALAGSKHFEETVLSLSAAIQILGVKLNSLPGSTPAIDLRATVANKAA